MKNYYYFLGIQQDATEEEIKSAYRKLSMKYHPDKNENDVFFAARFLEIQEAYETLISPALRKSYDSGLDAGLRHEKSSLAPVIKSFTANKIHAARDEEIIIKWNTMHADTVKILPFGLERAFGERTFKITEFKEGKFVLILHATNSHTRQTAVQGITITQVAPGDRERFREETEKLFRERDTSAAQGEAKVSRAVQIILALLFVLLALYFLLSVF